MIDQEMSLWLWEKDCLSFRRGFADVQPFITQANNILLWSRIENLRHCYSRSRVGLDNYVNFKCKICLSKIVSLTMMKSVTTRKGSRTIVKTPVRTLKFLKQK